MLHLACLRRVTGTHFSLAPILWAVAFGLFSGAVRTQSQASKLTLTHRFGQTFIVWTEGSGGQAPDSYRVYSSSTPIKTAADLSKAKYLATVPKGSSMNQRLGSRFILKKGASPLSSSQGFLVLTPKVAGKRFFAVLGVLKGKENSSLSTGPNGNSGGPVTETLAGPKPILQKTSSGGKEHWYVHFAPAEGRVGLPDQANVPGRAFNYRLYFDSSQTGKLPVVFLLHGHSQTFKSTNLPSWTPKNAVLVFPDDDNPPVTHSLWLGYHEKYGFGSPQGLVRDYTERRLLWLLDQVLADTRFQADPNRVYAFGLSFGAVGSLGLGVRHPDRFAAVGGLVPAFGVEHPDFRFGREIRDLFGSKAMNLKTSQGPRIYDILNFSGQMLTRKKAGVAPMRFFVGRADVTNGWTEKPAFFRSVIRNRQPGSLYWDYRTHSTSGAWTPLEQSLLGEMTEWRLDRPLPVLSNLSLDNNPGNGSPITGDGVGCMNGYAKVFPASIQESNSSVRFDLGLRSDKLRLDYAKTSLARVDLTLRRLKKFAIVPKAIYRLQVRAKGKTKVLEERVGVPDVDGLLTFSQVEIARTEIRSLTISRLSPSLPFAHAGGATHLQGTVFLSMHGAKTNPALLLIGSKKVQVQTPFGVWGIGDPIFVWGGVLPSTGEVEIPGMIPAIPGLKGARILVQGMVGAKFTNQTEFQIQ
jgi:pimeloyl-ACP methyl ester carboxylesterase